MNDKTYYRGIDCFRLIAAFLIIASHTSPLSSYSETGEFVLTHIIASVAVPFFFMTSGFFLISQYQHSATRLLSFVKKMAVIYGISILIYIPLNIYNNYFCVDFLLPNVIKDLVLDGTMYHLWYLPASIVGAVIAWLAVKKAGFMKALFLSFLLYVIGLFGDSYYGIAEKLPFLKGFYNCLFEVSDYTRNGIFFTPLFFVLGGMIADSKIRLSLKYSLIGFGVSFVAMLGEGLLLHHFGTQRHDSMYVLLPVCMFFLFKALTFWKGKRMAILRTSVLVIYIIHPMMIVAVRLFAKLTHTQSFLVSNSLIHYLLVSVLSVMLAALFMVLLYKVRHSKAKSSANERAWIEIDLTNLKHNVQVLKKAMPQDCNLMAVVKAGAYGHGAFEVSTYINKLGVNTFAVATIDEGIALRHYGIRGEILILGFTNPAQAKELHKYDLMQTLIDYDYAQQLNRQGYRIKAHIKIDTGMHRLGFNDTDTEAIKKAFTLKNITICGIFTHLCVPDSLTDGDVSFTELQIQRFYHTVSMLKENGITIPKTHIQSSYGFLNYPELKCSYVRAGVALYGVFSSPCDKTRLQLDLRPVLSLKSQIVLIRQIKSGESIGYGRSFFAKRESRIAIVPIGYADGFPRALSHKNESVLIHGKRVPIVGRICMDQLAVDITEVEDVRAGDIVTLIGTDGDNELSAADAADNADTIANELLSRIASRAVIKTIYR